MPVLVVPAHDAVLGDAHDSRGLGGGRNELEESGAGLDATGVEVLVAVEGREAVDVCHVAGHQLARQ